MDSGGLAMAGWTRPVPMALFYMSQQQVDIIISKNQALQILYPVAIRNHCLHTAINTNIP